MYRISYIDEKGRLAHKGGFKTENDAMTWANTNRDKIALLLKLLVWCDDIDCFSTVQTFYKAK